VDDLFRFSLDVDISKSDDSDRLIQGYASTEHSDRQGEELLQKGLDISDFVNYGYFNYDHDNTIILGYPLPTCKIDDRGFFVQGKLLKGMPEADKIWNLALALKKSSAPRKLGFSVEGKVLKREGNRIVKARIYNVAITPNPVNTNCTWEVLAKSFTGEDVIKALEAGYEVDPLKLEGGGVFREEELEDDIHNLSYVIDDEDKKKILKQKLSTKKSLTCGETMIYLQLIHGMSQAEARSFITTHIQ
jgi:hypothetical protein